MTEVKICGITEEKALKAALDSGARYIGLVFYPKSPRFIDPEQARIISRMVPTGVRVVGLFVDPQDDWLEKVFSAVPLDMIQLHGQETPVRVSAIRSRYNLPVIKAVPIGNKEDLGKIDMYVRVADWVLCDAKAPNSTDFGGTGQSFDWTLLKNRKFAKPWMLSGGLTAENVADALSVLQPDAVDVSSGVEISRGVKDPSKIADFIQTVKNG